MGKNGDQNEITEQVSGITLHIADNKLIIKTSPFF
jgi:hypothetical protein